jgi:hypothetical protein
VVVTMMIHCRKEGDEGHGDDCSNHNPIWIKYFLV